MSLFIDTGQGAKEHIPFPVNAQISRVPRLRQWQLDPWAVTLAGNLRRDIYTSSGFKRVILRQKGERVTTHVLPLSKTLGSLLKANTIPLMTPEYFQTLWDASNRVFWFYDLDKVVKPYEEKE